MADAVQEQQTGQLSDMTAAELQTAIHGTQASAGRSRMISIGNVSIGILCLLTGFLLPVLSEVAAAVLLTAGLASTSFGLVNLGRTPSNEKDLQELAAEEKRRELLEQLVKAGDLSPEAALRRAPGLRNAFNTPSAVKSAQPSAAVPGVVPGVQL